MRGMQIKTTIRYHLTPIRMVTIKKTKQNQKTSVGENVEKFEPLCTVSGNVKCGKQYSGGSSKKLKIELPYDPAIPILGIYPKELKTES